MLGIDVSKDTLSCILLDAATRRQLWHKEVHNTAAGWKQLLRHTPPAAPWVLEPTGRYSQEVARAARQAGRDVRLAQPKKAQLFLKCVQSRAKTDKLDAAGLALYGLSCQGTSCDLAPYPLKSAGALRAGQEELDQLLSARRTMSQSLCELQARQGELPRAAATLAPAVASLQEQIAARAAQRGRPPARRVDHSARAASGSRTAKGAGHRAGDCGNFGVSLEGALVWSFGSVCGLLRLRVPPGRMRVRQSGKKSGQWGLSKQGEAELRRLLYLAAQASLRAKDSPFKAQYERERAKGLSSTAALCAVARKMARLSWSIVHHHSTYDPARVYQQS